MTNSTDLDGTPTCNSCGCDLTPLDIEGSLSELGFGLYEAICGTCYENCGEI